MAIPLAVSRCRTISSDSFNWILFWSCNNKQNSHNSNNQTVDRLINVLYEPTRNVIDTHVVWNTFEGDVSPSHEHLAISFS